LGIGARVLLLVTTPAMRPEPALGEAARTLSIGSAATSARASMATTVRNAGPTRADGRAYSRVGRQRHA
jgi:hypothetical protein